LLLAELVEEALERLLLLALGQVEQFAGGPVHHQRDVAVMPADGLLVDQQHTQAVQLGRWQLPAEDRLVPAEGRGVVDPNNLCYVRQRHMPRQTRDELHEPPRRAGVLVDAAGVDRGETPADTASTLDRLVYDQDHPGRSPGQVAGCLAQQAMPVHPASAAGAPQAVTPLTAKVHLDKLAAHGNLADDIALKGKQPANPVHVHGSASCRSTSLDNPLNKQRLSHCSSGYAPARMKKGHLLRLDRV